VRQPTKRLPYSSKRAHTETVPMRTKPLSVPVQRPSKRRTRSIVAALRRAQKP
jgi:hypothetical protein